MTTEAFPHAFSFYPTAAAVDDWADTILFRAATPIIGTLLDDQPIRPAFGNSPNALQNRFVRFDADDGRRPFYGYWQPALKQPAPLLINLPGYGGYISMHPQLCDLGYNILHISPQGYVTPDHTADELRLSNRQWPVLHNTAAGLPGGYADWLTDCLLAIRWARALPEVLSHQFSLFGTSQGGGTALLLASLLPDARCVCADLPFLTAFPLSGLKGSAYGLLQDAYGTTPEKSFWNRLGYIDTLSHTHRLHLPVMLSCGELDDTCPPCTIEALFARLHCTKQLTCLTNGVHTHSRESIFLFAHWLQMFA